MDVGILLSVPVRLYGVLRDQYARPRPRFASNSSDAKTTERLLLREQRDVFLLCHQPGREKHCAMAAIRGTACRGSRRFARIGVWEGLETRRRRWAVAAGGLTGVFRHELFGLEILERSDKIPSSGGCPEKARKAPVVAPAARGRGTEREAVRRLEARGAQSAPTLLAASVSSCSSRAATSC